jgi:uncharacterized membrane protein (UPF0127 family)
MDTVHILNTTRGTVLADRAEVARSFLARGIGLMGRAALPEGYALLIYPEWSIHMLFMKIPLDVLFVDREHTVVGLRESLPPWSPYAGVSPGRGRYVVEMPAGVISATATALGDRLEITPPLF